jgi:hypothetical protein
MNEDRITDTQTQPVTYQIRVEGQLGGEWAGWFEGMTLTQVAGDTLLFGAMPDQARLYGVLRKVRDLGLPLVSVMRIPAGEVQHTQGDF